MNDQQYMRRALMLAERGAGRVSPNPMVGCVIVKNGRVIGEGWHAQCGGPHAERAALAACAESPRGGTLFVTLEPCCHWGRTPPCTDAIIAEGLARVVVGCLDANPLVAGKGVQTLQSAGVDVETGVLEPECKRLNEVFFHYIQRKTPFVVLKYAMTLDGKIASRTGDSKWITGEAARAHVHQTRNRLSAILVGLGTVLQDDPLLTCRMEGGRDPLRVVCDSHLHTSPDCRLVRSARQAPLLIAAIERNGRAGPLEQAGAEIVLCSAAEGRVDLADLMRRLGARGVDSVLLEGGAALHFAALQAGIVNKVQAYIAPKLIGGAGAKSPVGGLGFPKMDDALPLQNLTVTPLGADFLMEGDLPCSPVS